MHRLSDEETEFLDTLGRIRDPKLRYFFIMLGGAIAESVHAQSLAPCAPANGAPEVGAVFRGARRRRAGAG